MPAKARETGRKRRLQQQAGALNGRGGRESDRVGKGEGGVGEGRWLKWAGRRGRRGERSGWSD